MKLIITGSRDWEDVDYICDALDLFSKRSFCVELIHGACPTGADDMAQYWADYCNASEVRSVGVTRYPADWSQGKKAGPERNKFMVSENLDADYVLAFPLGESRGTRHCMAYAKSMGLTVVNLGET